MANRIPLLPSLLKQLVSTTSVSCTTPDYDQSNLPVIELLATWLDDLGFSTEITPVPGLPGKANLIATLGSGPGGLVLAGHTDTVPYDERLWQYNPLALTEKDNRYYGLGTSDMKGFFPIAIEAAKFFLNQPLKKPLIILATADEESSMSGAQALVAMGKPVARHAIIGEPTGMKPVRMHKGVMMESLHIQGKSGHSSNPDFGINALEAMHAVLSEVLNFRNELKHSYHSSHFDVAYPTLNLGCIHGGDNPNRICGSCELQIDLRPLPGMDLDNLRETIYRRSLAITDKYRVKFDMRSLFPGIPAYETPADAAIVKAAEKLSGHSAIGVNFGTEAPYLAQLGMQTVVLGPGDIDQAHQPDEYLAIDRIQPTINLLKGLIATFCL